MYSLYSLGDENSTFESEAGLVTVIVEVAAFDIYIGLCDI